MAVVITKFKALLKFLGMATAGNVLSTTFLRFAKITSMLTKYGIKVTNSKGFLNSLTSFRHSFPIQWVLVWHSASLYNKVVAGIFHCFIFFSVKVCSLYFP